MKDVYEQARDSALQAARQKQSESSSRSQNLLRAYCKARLAIEELEQVAGKYGVAPRQVVAQDQPATAAAVGPDKQMNPEESETMIVPYNPMAPSSLTSPKTPALRRCRTTKDGHFRPLAVRTSPLPTDTPATAAAPGDSLVARGLSWIKDDLGCRIGFGLAWMTHCAPLCAHAIWVLALCLFLYVVSRPQLLVRFLVFCTEHTVRVATTSGRELLHELDRVLLDQSAYVAKAVSEVDPITWAQNTLFARPADYTAIVENAVSQATAQLSASSSTGQVDATATAKVAAQLAVDSATRQLSAENLNTASSSEAPAGSGIFMLVITILSVAKAGKFLS